MKKSNLSYKRNGKAFDLKQIMNKNEIYENQKASSPFFAYSL